MSDRHLAKNPAAVRMLKLGLGLIALGALTAFGLSVYWLSFVQPSRLGSLVVLLGLCYLTWRQYAAARILLYVIIAIGSLALLLEAFRPGLPIQYRLVQFTLLACYAVGVRLILRARSLWDTYPPAAAPFGAHPAPN